MRERERERESICVCVREREHNMIIVQALVMSMSAHGKLRGIMLARVWVSVQVCLFNPINNTLCSYMLHCV